MRVDLHGHNHSDNLNKVVSTCIGSIWNLNTPQMVEFTDHELSGKYLCVHIP